MTREIIFTAVAGGCLFFCGCASQQQGATNLALTSDATPPANVAPRPAETVTPNTNDRQLKVFITLPKDKATVPARAAVEGTVADANASVWVVVHPLEAGDYWVQQPVSVGPDRTWKVLAHVGEPGTKAGTGFEIRAVANPKTQLREGDVLRGWPDAQWSSQVVEVVR